MRSGLCCPWLILLTRMVSIALLIVLTASSSSAVNQQEQQHVAKDSEHDSDNNHILDVLVLICTQSFTGEQLVEDVLMDRFLMADTDKNCSNKFWNVKAVLVDEADFDWTLSSASQQPDDDGDVKLKNQARVVLVVASTWGDGDPPHHATEFANWLGNIRHKGQEGQGWLDSVPYAVFGLGDSNYLHFNAFAKYVDTQLAARGGHRMVPLYLGDASRDGGGGGGGVDVAGLFETWCHAVMEALNSVLSPPSHCDSLLSDGNMHHHYPQEYLRPIFASTGTDWRRSAIQPNSVVATLTNKQNLIEDVAAGADRLPVLHVDLTLPPFHSSTDNQLLQLEPQPGDHVGIYPRNDHDIVQRALDWLGIKANMKTKVMEQAQTPRLLRPALNTTTTSEATPTTTKSNTKRWIERGVSAYEFLAAHVDLTGRARPSTLRALLPFVGTLQLRALARELTFINTTAFTTTTKKTTSTTQHKSAFDNWVGRRWLTNLDLAILFECRPSLQALARAIGPMQPRLYSIVTVNYSTDRQYHVVDDEQRHQDKTDVQQQTNDTPVNVTLGLCISVVERGLCTNFLRNQPLESKITVFLRKSRFHFGVVDNDGSPALMVGAGSGLGPYVGFLEQEITRQERTTGIERVTNASLSHIRIYFGSRSPSEILYKDRLSQFESLGSHVFFAFSRVFGHARVHVQDLLLRDNKTVWRDLFESGGRIFVCGRLEVYTGVKSALVEIATLVGGLHHEAAYQRVENLEKSGRLLADCWSVDPPRKPEEIFLPEDPTHRAAIARLERHHAAESTCSLNPPNVDLSNIPAWPSYLRLVASGEFERRIENATNMFSACVACGRFCEVNRLSDSPEDWGECRVGSKAIVSSAEAHFGEEDCLKGTHGSGTIFFGACNLKCIYCQNWELSVMDKGDVIVDEERLASMMLMLQDRGCHNINLVSPTHNVLAILKSIYIAAREGLRLPIVWNSGGYDSVASLRLLEGIVDIYLPDAKYASRAVARKLSLVDNYPDINQAAIKEMHRQVGDLQIDPRTGLAWRGVLVRHLILPQQYAGTYDIATFLANEVSTDTYTNVMDQYRPEHKARFDKKFGLDRKPTFLEMRKAHEDTRCGSLWRIYEPLHYHYCEEDCNS